MKTIITIFSLAFLFIACQPPVDNSAAEAFEKNSQTALAYMEAWAGESVDYDALFAEDYWTRPTGFGSPDSMGLEKVKESNTKTWAAMDFKKPEKVSFLPGVNADTKEMDGSVRYYGNWTAIIPATDSTEEITGVIKIYQSIDFNEEGKIAFIQSFGDWGGMSKYFENAMGGDDDDDDNDDDGDGEE